MKQGHKEKMGQSQQGIIQVMKYLYSFNVSFKKPIQGRLCQRCDGEPETQYLPSKAGSHSAPDVLSTPTISAPPLNNQQTVHLLLISRQPSSRAGIPSHFQARLKQSQRLLPGGHMCGKHIQSGLVAYPACSFFWQEHSDVLLDYDLSYCGSCVMGLPVKCFPLNLKPGEKCLIWANKTWELNPKGNTEQNQS